MDVDQLRAIVLQPDNISIVLLLGGMVFFSYYGLRQSRANDRLIAELEADDDRATRPRRPTDPNWSPTVPVWPYLLRIELLAAIVVTVLLLVWSLVLNAPLGEPAKLNVTMNPAKAPWYFVGLQELLVYFDPWLAGAVLPALIIGGLMLFPYLDASPLGAGYYALRQRRVALGAFGAGLLLWIGAIGVGTFMRGPGWMWFWPWQTWDHTRVLSNVERNLPQLVGVNGGWAQTAVGLGAIALFYATAAWAVHRLVTWSATDRRIYARTSRLQYVVFQFFAVTLLAGVPAKILLRLLFDIKYVLVTPWFNI